MMLVSPTLPNAWAVASGGEVTAKENFIGCIPVVMVARELSSSQPLLSG